MLNKHKKKRTIKTINHVLTEQERAENEKILAELQKSDLRVFNKIFAFILDGDEKKEFLEIFDTYTKNKKTSLPTLESLTYVKEQLEKDAEEGTNFFAVITIGANVKNLDAASYRELIDYAFEEFEKAKLCFVIPLTQFRPLSLIVIYDFIIRHPEVVWTLRRISELRYKIRKRDNLEVSGFVGF